MFGHWKEKTKTETGKEARRGTNYTLAFVYRTNNKHWKFIVPSRCKQQLPRSPPKDLVWYGIWYGVGYGMGSGMGLGMVLA